MLRTLTSRPTTAAVAVTIAVATFAACGEPEVNLTGPATTTVTSPTAATPTTVVTPGGVAAADRGWVGGEPEWSTPSAPEGGTRVAAASAEMAAEDAPVPGYSVAPGAVPVDADAGPLRAGSVDDNADFDGYLTYLDRVRSIGVPLRAFDPRGRVVVSVRGADGLPVHGATVDVAAGGVTVASLRTTADGTARFLPALYGQDVEGTFDVTVGGTTVAATAGGSAEVVLDQPGGAAGEVPLDVLFLLDATGSMGDEIDRLKTSIDSVAARVDALAANPDVRFGMTVYRDLEDAFVTRTFDFTSDVEVFRTALAAVVADGGGDYPEALDEGLAEALTVPSWRDPATTVQLVFLVADAPPQVARQLERGYPESIADAVTRGIKIFPVASSESDDQAEAVFRQIAQATGARFVFLSYGAQGAATGGSTDIGPTDYEELALDDLVVRLIAEELAALTGDTTIVPTPVPPPTTTPSGQ